MAEIPPTPPGIRTEADARLAAGGADTLLSELDPATAARIDRLNPVRIQRAWEVWRATGRGLASWQDDTPPPLLPLDRTLPLVLDAPRDWLAPRIERRVDLMVAGGVLEEALANRPGWSPTRPSAKAIGASELMEVIDGDLSLADAKVRICTLTRQYAKRQRTWFRSRMAGWSRVRND